MNKSLKSLFCLCAVAAMFGSCQKDDSAPNMTLHATIADHYTPNESNAKVVLNNYTPTFLNGDEVWINGQKFTAAVEDSDIELSCTTSVSAPYAAVYPYDLVTGTETTEDQISVLLTLPAEQSYETAGNDANGNPIQIINAPMAAYSTSEALDFQNVCALVRIRVRNNYEGEGDITLSSITITASDAYLSGSASITGSAGNYTLAVSSGSKSVTLTGLSEVVKVNKSSKDYYIYIPPISDETLTITVNGKYSDKTLGEFTQVSTSGVSLAKSKIGAAAHRLNDCEYYFTKAFSVAADRQVYFSSGNLQYQPSTETFRFAENQWVSFLGSSTYGNNLSERDRKTTDKWLDHFGWGTSGWNGSGATYFMPYNRQSGSDGNKGYGYGPTANSYAQSLTGDYANADWGVYNVIQNGNNKNAAGSWRVPTSGTWRTPTSSEWSYLFGNASRKARATVNGVTGLILLPDSWKKPVGISITLNPINSTTNNYSLDEWGLLEKYGAIFLPQTGKYGSRITNDYTASSITSNTKNMGFYWSSTVYNTSNAYSFYFYNTRSDTQDGGVGSKADYGLNVKNGSLAVRLVRDVE